MLKFLANSKLLIISTSITVLMFIVVMFFANPQIDGNNGLGVLQLQVAFDKELGIEIVKSWGVNGTKEFKALIFTDYLYALSYTLTLSSLLASLIYTKNLQNSAYRLSIYLIFLAGFMDILENSMELAFLTDMQKYSDTLFFIHSLVSSLKWLILPLIFTTIVVLILKKKENI